ncbi:thymidylate kinase [Candidatus Parcubacteria bacterium]|nr:thymidylate kinase [Candidatus Parcubacteria bacterium]
MQGKLIVLDGNDGSGKQTQAEMLRTFLIGLGFRVLPLSFPRYEDTFFGRILKRSLAGEYGDFANLDPHLAAPIYAADRWSSKPLMKEFLASGGFVLCDRYVSANQIHQGGKIVEEAKRADFLAWLDQLEYGEFRLPRPDVSVYLDVPPAVSRQLMSDRTRDTVESNPAYLENSHRSAQWLIAREPERWVHIRCTTRGLMRKREEIHLDIVTRLKDRKIL